MMPGVLPTPGRAGPGDARGRGPGWGIHACMHPLVTRWSRRAGAHLVSGSLRTPQGSPIPQVGGASPGPNKTPEVAKMSRWLYPHPTPGVIATPRGRPGAGEARGAGHPGTGPAKVKPESDLTPLRARATGTLRSERHTLWGGELQAGVRCFSPRYASQVSR